MNCRKCGGEITGIAGDHAAMGGDPLCGVGHCYEEDREIQREQSHERLMLERLGNIEALLRKLVETQTKLRSPAPFPPFPPSLPFHYP